MNSLIKLYEKLSADERARLFIAAAARRDVQELDRLNDTCPRKSYIMEDRDYSRRKINLWILTLAHRGDMSRLEFLAMASLTVLTATARLGKDELVRRFEREFPSAVACYYD
jgi:hypothetical protein